MARLKNGFLGDAQGKINNVVIAKWRDMFTVKKYTEHINDRKSPAQILQREKMLKVLSILQPLKQKYIDLFYRYNRKNSPGWGLAIQQLMPAIQDDLCIDGEKFELIKGTGDSNDFVSQEYDFYTDNLKVQLKWNHGKTIIGSILGVKQITEEGLIVNDDMNVVMLPSGSFTCWFEDWEGWVEAYNYWGSGPFGGFLWCLYWPDQQQIDRMMSNALITPKTLIPSLVSNIPVDFFADLPVIPKDAVSFAYRVDGTDIYLDISVVWSDLIALMPDLQTFQVGVKGLVQDLYIDFPALNFNSTTETNSILLVGDQLTFHWLCGGIGMSSTFVQLSKPQKFYYNINQEGTESDYFSSLFNTGQFHAYSFILPDQKTGICGDWKELFPQFIANEPDFDYKKLIFYVYKDDGTRFNKCIVNQNGYFWMGNLNINTNYWLIVTYDYGAIFATKFNSNFNKHLLCLSPILFQYNNNVCKGNPPWHGSVKVKIKTRRERGYVYDDWILDFIQSLIGQKKIPMCASCNAYEWSVFDITKTPEVDFKIV